MHSLLFRAFGGLTLALAVLAMSLQGQARADPAPTGGGETGFFTCTANCNCTVVGGDCYNPLIKACRTACDCVEVTGPTCAPK